MNMIHEQVHHLKFGTGTVTAQDLSTVTVQFTKEYGLKKFLYPAAFRTFLELCSPSAKEQMTNELQLIETQEEKERNSRLAEEVKHRAFLEQKRVPKKRTSVNKRFPKKAPAETEPAEAEQDFTQDFNDN